MSNLILYTKQFTEPPRRRWKYSEQMFDAYKKKLRELKYNLEQGHITKKQYDKYRLAYLDDLRKKMNKHYGTRIGLQSLVALSSAITAGTIKSIGKELKLDPKDYKYKVATAGVLSGTAAAAAGFEGIQLHYDSQLLKELEKWEG